MSLSFARSGKKASVDKEKEKEEEKRPLWKGWAGSDNGVKYSRPES